MNCPVCNVALNMTERQGVEIDYCPKCRGVWLDRGSWTRLSNGRPLRRVPDLARSLPTVPRHRNRNRSTGPGNPSRRAIRIKATSSPSTKRNSVITKRRNLFWASYLILIDFSF